MLFDALCAAAVRGRAPPSFAAGQFCEGNTLSRVLPPFDFHLFKFADPWHTRGFYERTAALYHLAKGTPRKKLFWAPVPGGRWRIDWQKTNRGDSPLRR
jgi:hypothetical protein